MKLFEGGYSSVHSLIDGSSRFEEIETIMLKEIVNSYDFIDLLKINIEGRNLKPSTISI